MTCATTMGVIVKGKGRVMRPCRHGPPEYDEPVSSVASSNRPRSSIKTGEQIFEVLAPHFGTGDPKTARIAGFIIKREAGRLRVWGFRIEGNVEPLRQ